MSYPIKRIAIFGHRGVGKSSFLKRLKSYSRDPIPVFDLDNEIEIHLGLSIDQIFSTRGEVLFRSYEKEIFNNIISKNQHFIISVGGGFPVQEIPPDIYCIWTQRQSDKFGRIFFDRPRLNEELSDLEEYKTRAHIRSIAFQNRADERYLMSEGLSEKNLFGLQTEKSIFSFLSENNKTPIHFDYSTYLTLTSFFFGRAENKDSIFKSFYLDKVRYSGFEIRDDLLTEEHFEVFTKKFESSNLIISYRKNERITSTSKFISNLRRRKQNLINVDWALELGPPNPDCQATILSMHNWLGSESLSEFLCRLESQGNRNFHLKASPIIDSWEELIELYHWQQQDSENRSILPRSQDGRWAWFRLFQKGRQKINFWKDSDGSAADQPTLFEWLTAPLAPTKFAAVLGCPVALSHTPSEQMDYFHQYAWPVFRIDIKEHEWSAALPFLEKIGLSAAAITAPLKKLAFQLITAEDAPAFVSQLQSVNTIARKTFKGKIIWRGTNTDLEGLSALVTHSLNEIDKNINDLNVIIWGGGGTLPVIREVFPKSIEYSIRTGSPRDGASTLSFDHSKKTLIIWAAGPTDPVPHFPADYVIDLNYREDSAGRSYAKKVSAQYFSGTKMFLKQAQCQRLFWDKAIEF